MWCTMAVFLQENTNFPAVSIDGYQKMYLAEADVLVRRAAAELVE
jgi:hypothetical protein